MNSNRITSYCFRPSSTKKRAKIHCEATKAQLRRYRPPQNETVAPSATYDSNHRQNDEAAPAGCPRGNPRKVHSSWARWNRRTKRLSVHQMSRRLRKQFTEKVPSRQHSEVNVNFIAGKTIFRSTEVRRFIISTNH